MRSRANAAALVCQSGSAVGSVGLQTAGRTRPQEISTLAQRVQQLGSPTRRSLEGRVSSSCWSAQACLSGGLHAGILRTATILPTNGGSKKGLTTILDAVMRSGEMSCQTRWLQILGLIALSSCAHVKVSQEVPSPSGRQVARFYGIASGGAAGSLVLRVDVRDRDQRFRADDEYVFEMRHEYEVRLTWTDDHHLIVDYPSDAVVYRTTAKKDLVSITYRPQSALNQQ